MLVRKFLLLILLFSNIALTSAKDKTTDFDFLKMEKELESIARQLEQSLAISHNNLPLLDVVKDFNADKTGLNLTTTQIQNAVDSCTKLGAARIYFPKGVYLIGTIVLKSGVHIELHEEAKILGSTNVEDYLVIQPDYKNNTDLQVDKSLFYAENVDGISFTGKGTIDFQGDHPVYFNTGNNDPRRPFGIRIISSKNIYISGLMLINSAQWMQHYLNCENLLIENLNVFNHAHQNNDGLDIDGCKNVYVRNCYIDSDDDAICLKSNGPSSCENVLIENCTASSHCNALKLGTETTGGFKNIIYRNCKVIQSATGYHHVNGSKTTRTAITLIITDGGKMENVWLNNIDAEDCIAPIFVTLGNRSRKHTQEAPVPDIGNIKNIKISNFSATSAGPQSSSVTGLNNKYCINNVFLENIHIEVKNPGSISDRDIDMEKLLQEKKPKYPSPHIFGNLPSYGFYFRYINGLTTSNITFDLKCDDPRDEIIIEDCERVEQQ